MLQKKLIIDGNNLLHRTYNVAFNLQNKNQEKIKPQAYLYFFLNTLKSYIKKFGSSEVIICWDYRDKDQINVRKTEYAEYKQQRSSNNEIYMFKNELKDILDSLGVKQLYPKKFEADDIMYWLCSTKLPNQCVLVSGDTDMYQLINEELNENIIFNPTKELHVNSVYLIQNFNVKNGRQFIIRKALKGDKSDNLPGVKCIRKDKISKIIEAVGENFMLENAKEFLKEHEYDTFVRNMKLMSLQNVLNDSEEIEWYEFLYNKEPNPNKDNFKRLITELEFWNISKNLNSWYNTFQNVESKIKVNDFYFKLFDD